MAWLHTWFGLVLGFVLMVVFFFGALWVFDREIDRWALPGSRFQPQPMPSFDRVLKPAFERMQPARENVALLAGRVGPIPEHFDTVHRWGAYTTHFDPVVAVSPAMWRPARRTRRRPPGPATRFRRDRSVQRGALDLHNLTGVVALPFHLFFAFPGRRHAGRDDRHRHAGRRDAMLVANRLPPPTLAGKGGWETAVFWGAWGAALPQRSRATARWRRRG